MLANYEQKGCVASNLLNTCWNCNSTEHQARKCPTPLSAKARDMIEGSDQKIALYRQKQKDRQASSPSKYKNHSGQKDSRRRREAEYDDGNEGDEEVQSSVREKIPTPSWTMKTGGGANLSQGSYLAQ